MSDIKNIAEYLKSEEKEIRLYHKNGKIALGYFKRSNGYWYENTYDENGNRLTLKNSNGVQRCFNVKELTIEEIQKELGYKVKIVE